MLNILLPFTQTPVIYTKSRFCRLAQFELRNFQANWNGIKAQTFLIIVVKDMLTSFRRSALERPSADAERPRMGYNVSTLSNVSTQHQSDSIFPLN